MEKHSILITFKADSPLSKEVLKKIDSFFTSELKNYNLNFKISFFKETIPLSKQIIDKIESIPENFSKKLTDSASEAESTILKEESFKEKFSSFVKEKGGSAKESSKNLFKTIKNKVSKTK